MVGGIYGKAFIFIEISLDCSLQESRRAGKKGLSFCAKGKPPSLAWIFNALGLVIFLYLSPLYDDFELVSCLDFISYLRITLGYRPTDSLRVGRCSKPDIRMWAMIIEVHVFEEMLLNLGCLTLAANILLIPYFMYKQFWLIGFILRLRKFQALNLHSTRIAQLLLSGVEKKYFKHLSHDSWFDIVKCISDPNYDARLYHQENSWLECFILPLD